MDLKDAIKVLDYHQRWRQGIEEDMKYKPLQLTEALDIVLEQVKKLNIDDVSNNVVALFCGCTVPSLNYGITADYKCNKCNRPIK